MPFKAVLNGFIKNEKDVPDKTVLIKEGNRTDFVLILLDGQVKIKKKTQKGLVTIDTLKPGAVLGEMLLIDPEQVTSSASAVADGPVRIGVLDKEKILRELEKLSPQSKEIVVWWVRRLKHKTEILRDLALNLK